MLSKDKMLRVVFSIPLKILFYKQDSNSLHLLFQVPWEVAKLPGVSQQVAFTALLSIKKLAAHLFLLFSFKPTGRKSIKLNWVNVCAYAFRVTEVTGCYNEVQTVLVQKAAYRATREEVFFPSVIYYLMRATETMEVQRLPWNQCSSKSRITRSLLQYAIFSKLKHKYCQGPNRYLRKQLSTKAFFPPAHQRWTLEVAGQGGAGLGEQEKLEGAASTGDKPSDKPCWQNI